jgi:hypothetical protein
MIQIEYSGFSFEPPSAASVPYRGAPVEAEHNILSSPLFSAAYPLRASRLPLLKVVMI